MRQFRFQLRVEPGRGRLRNLIVGVICVAALPLLMLVGLTFWFAALALAFVVVVSALCIALVRRLVSRTGPSRH
jgi:hypothetical protein